MPIILYTEATPIFAVVLASIVTIVGLFFIKAHVRSRVEAPAPKRQRQSKGKKRA